jgi:hypothetical protein
MDAKPSAEDRELHRMQARAFAYFLKECDPVTGLIADKTAPDWPASVAATGLALACYPVAVERGLMPHDAAVARTLKTLRFFHQAPQGEQPDATGYKGFYYHFLDMRSGRRAWHCELSTVDSGFLIAGMLAAACYFEDDTPDQREIRDLATALYERVDWRWAQNGRATLTHGWKPETGFLKYRWEGYDEALLLYVLALGSPTHAVTPDAYAAWVSTYEWMKCYDIDYVYSGPLFTHQLSHVWIDFRGIRDAYMRARGIDYFENSRRAAQIQRRYAIDNPQRYVGYGSESWGISASDGPGPAKLRIDGIWRRFYDYEGRGAPYGIDDGTLAPWAVVASLPFAPDIVLPAIRHCVRDLGLHDDFEYGFRATYNRTFDNQPGPAYGWVSPFHFGLNLGPNVLMIENHRSGMLWHLMRGCRPIVDGLRRAGFDGGWL